jgi:hypothetical protein
MLERLARERDLLVSRQPLRVSHAAIVFEVRTATWVAVLAFVVAGCSHRPGVDPRALASPRGSIAPLAVDVVGGNSADRSAVDHVLRGFGKSEVLRLAIAEGYGPQCDGTRLHFTVRPDVGVAARGWWDAQVVAGAFARARGRPVCVISIRTGRGGVDLASGPGVPEYGARRFTQAEIDRAVRMAVRGLSLSVVAVVPHRPARLVPEVVLLTRDPTHFEQRMDRFDRRLSPLWVHLDASYIAVRNPCGKPVWFAANSNATAAGSVGADRHWICPFGDAVLQHCPKRHATTANPCL